MLRKEFKLAAKQGLTLEISDAAKQFMLAQNDQPQYGARPLRRIITRHLRQPLADFLLANGTNAQGATIKVDASENSLTFGNVAEKENN